MVGSTVFKQTWKERVTPSGTMYWEHTASVLRISDKDFTGEPSTVVQLERTEADGWRTPNAQMIEAKDTVTKFHGRTPLDPQVGLADQARLAGWPTPAAQEPGNALERYEGERQRRTATATKSDYGMCLTQAAQMAGWRTPDSPSAGGPRTHTTSQDQGHQVCLEEQAHLAGWPTAQASDANQRQGPGTASNQRNIERGQLANVATLAGWGTPRVTTNGGIPCPESTGKGSRLEDQAAMASGSQSSTTAKTVKSGESPPPLRLNPYFSAWLMGFPVGWTRCGQRVASLFVRRSKAGFSS